MSRILEGLKPERVFYYFEEISRIPRGSYHEEAVSNYLVDWAKKKHLKVVQDAQNNMLITKPASRGMEHAPVAVLQGHMDMVCEKEREVEHDFQKDPLKLCVKGDDLTAQGTTLGGDDGIAVAYVLAILEDEELKHPALEVLITTQEEVGMEGAFYFDASQLQGKYLINLDSEEEGCVLTACAGGATLTVTYPLQRRKKAGQALEIVIRGCSGGHSGAEIHLGKANAVILMAQFLQRLQETGIDYDLCEFAGGLKSNAIPRSGSCCVCVQPTEKECVQNCAAIFEQEMRKKYEAQKEAITVTVQSVERKPDIWEKNSAEALVQVIANMPDGVYKMSSDLAGKVETSSNLGIAKMDEKQIQLVILARSSREKGLDEVLEKLCEQLTKKKEIETAFGNGVQVTISERYPGWEYEEHSPLRTLVMDAYKKQYGISMRADAIHAGLECGILAAKKKMDMVSIGPDILDIHTPKETLKIASVARTYRMLQSVLARFSELPL